MAIGDFLSRFQLVFLARTTAERGGCQSTDDHSIIRDMASPDFSNLVRSKFLRNQHIARAINIVISNTQKIDIETFTILRIHAVSVYSLDTYVHTY
jgi:NADP-dependent 3-hydroxy acid dehydrogenase YdfG